MTKHTMLRGCATTAITSMDEQRNRGIVLMINFTLRECARIVTSTTITVRNGQKSRVKSRAMKKKMSKAWRKVLNDVIELIHFPHQFTYSINYCIFYIDELIVPIIAG